MHNGFIKQLMEPIMKSLLRRNLLILMLGVTAATLSLNANTPAFAKDGHSGSDSSSDSDGGSGSDGDSDSDGDSSGSDSDSDSDGDSSGSGGNDDSPGHDSGDDSSDDGGHHSSGSDDDDDDDSNDDNSNDSSSNSGGRDRQRPEIELSLDAASLAGVRNGSLAVVDNLGRVLEVEFDTVNGSQVVTGKPHGGDTRRNPGPIASVSIVPSSQAPVHQ
jgi:hypothetical protein